jgi:hypothetical protein
MQIAETTFEPLGVPDWCLTMVILLVALGFPLAIALAWAVQLTKDGPVLEMPVASMSRDESRVARAGLRYLLVVALVGVIGLLSYKLLSEAAGLATLGGACPVEAIQDGIAGGAPGPARWGSLTSSSPDRAPAMSVPSDW